MSEHGNTRAIDETDCMQESVDLHSVAVRMNPASNPCNRNCLLLAELCLKSRKSERLKGERVSRASSFTLCASSANSHARLCDCSSCHSNKSSKTKHENQQTDR